jgi:WD40 repeat protein
LFHQAKEESHPLLSLPKNSKLVAFKIKMEDQCEKRRLLPRENAGIKQVALKDTIESKYQIRLLFKLLGKQNKTLRGVCDDDAWVMQQFAEMLHVPKYVLIKICPRGYSENFSFHPLIYKEKVYSKVTFSSKIRVTNCNNDNLITTLIGHNSSVLSLIIDDGKLYSGSADTTIKIWNCRTDTLIKTLTGHTGWVLCLTISDGLLYSGSGGDCSINVWNCRNHELITTLGTQDNDEERGHGHTAGVYCLTINDGTLYSGSGDRTIKVWDCSTNKLITTLEEHTASVMHLAIYGGKLYSQSRTDSRGAIIVYDCSDDSLITTLADSHHVTCLEFHDGKLYTTGNFSDMTIKVYDCRDDSLITTLRGHTQGVTELTIQNDKIYSKQSGGDIYIWQL